MFILSPFEQFQLTELTLINFHQLIDCYQLSCFRIIMYQWDFNIQYFLVYLPIYVWLYKCQFLFIICTTTNNIKIYLILNIFLILFIGNYMGIEGKLNSSIWKNKMFYFIESKLYLITSNYLNIALIKYNFINILKIINLLLCNIFEAIVINNIKNINIYWFLIPTIFIYIFLSNIIGLIPYSNSVTSYIFVVFLYAGTIFLSLNIAGIYIKGFYFLNIFYAKGTPFLLIPLLVVLEILSYIARIISLTVRLFANIVAGHLLLKVLGLFIWQVFPFGGITSKYIISNSILIIIPLLVFFALIVLELFVSFVQAYIFTLLLTFYIKDSVNLTKLTKEDLQL